MQNDNKILRSEYPRPDFVRQKWQTLNGIWEFEFDEKNNFENDKNFLSKRFTKEINVPFCYQAELSGINDTKDYDTVWYRRNFDCDMNGGNVLLKFGAVDYEAKVWVNGNYIGLHKGGNVGFEFDVTNFVTEKNNVLVVKATDFRNTDKPRGKQSWEGEKFGCWYTPTTGIWQSVWIEYAGENHFKYIKITPNVDELTASCEVFMSENYDTRISLTAEFSYNGSPLAPIVCEVTAKQGYAKAVFSFRNYDIRDNFLLWSPEHPNLINVTAKTIEENKLNDEVSTYFGMRKISVNHNRIMLNNHNLYQRLILDQGYWKESLLTPPSDEAIIKDIQLTLDMGFNGARKHQKIEDPRYYYWADKMGLLVWGELPSAYDFNDNAITNSSNELLEFVKRDFNHPCIITWVPINESWGVRQILSNAQQQNYAKMLYFLLKSIDKTRLISVNDGWEQLDENDICAVHDYALFPENLNKYDDLNKLMNNSTLDRLLYADNNNYKGQPIIMTEYGGIAFANTADENWGYFGKVKTEDEFFERLVPVNDMLVESRKFCGYCYTQLTDVQQEVNGLLTEDRKPKVSIDRLKATFGKRYY